MNLVFNGENRRSHLESRRLRSQSICFVPISRCLVEIENVIKPTKVWDPANTAQSRFLQLYYSGLRDQSRDLPEVNSIASVDAKVVNEFLRDQGFEIRVHSVRQESYDRHIYTASAFKLRLQWLKPGRVTAVCDGAYPAVRIEESIQFFRSTHASNTVVAIPTMNNDTVYMTILDNPPTEFELLDRVVRISNSLVADFEFEGVVFPMINYDEEIDISWMAGMTTESMIVPWIIEQALQQTKFRMNEIGVKVESAAAIGMITCRINQKPKLIIDRPFLLWICRPGMKYPIFIGHFTEANWKKPDNL